jgi:TRAP-type C4-dicarboxylate transport system substrate-binding protein
MLKEAGASITSMPSSETYHALSTGVIDTLLTSSASFVSYRLYEELKYINAPRDYSIWYMAENLIVSKKPGTGFPRCSKKSFWKSLNGCTRIGSIKTRKTEWTS